MFGREAMDHAQERIAAKLEGWGYRSARTDLFIRTFIAQLLLVSQTVPAQGLLDGVGEAAAGLARIQQRPAEHGMVACHNGKRLGMGKQVLRRGSLNLVRTVSVAPLRP